MSDTATPPSGDDLTVRRPADPSYETAPHMPAHHAEDAGNDQHTWPLYDQPAHEWPGIPTPPPPPAPQENRGGLTAGQVRQLNRIGGIVAALLAVLIILVIIQRSTGGTVANTAASTRGSVSQATRSATPVATTRTPLPATATATPIVQPVGDATITTQVQDRSAAYYNEVKVLLTNPADVTAMTVTVTIAKTPGVAYNNMYTTFPGGAVDTAYQDTGTALVYTFTLKSGQTIPAGQGWVLAAQYNGNGTVHTPELDRYQVTLTMGGTTRQYSGGFQG